MTPFEEELKKALARREPSPDFTERLLAQVSRSNSARRGWVTWRLATAAAATLVLAAGAAYQQHERHMEGQAAKEKLLVAMRIAGSKLQEAQQRVEQAESVGVYQ